LRVLKCTAYPYNTESDKDFLVGNLGLHFHFNGKENDNELIDWQDYGERMYMKRLGRFPTPDPLIVKGQKYPELSPYQFAGNTPIQAIDLDGLEPKYVSNKIQATSGDNLPHLRISNEALIQYKSNTPSIESRTSSDLNLKITAVVTFAEDEGASLRAKVEGFGLELTDVSKERDLVGWRDNKFVLNDKKTTDKFGVTLGIVGIDISQEKNKEAEVKGNIGPFEIGRNNRAIKVGGDALNFKFSLPLLKMGIEGAVKFESNSNESINKTENKN